MIFFLHLSVLFFFVNLLTSCGSSKVDSNFDPSRKAKYTPLSTDDAKKLLTPTVYYIPEIGHKSASCVSNKLKQVVSTEGEVLAELCEKEFRNCLLQGTCLVWLSAEKSILINYHKKIEDKYYFKSVDRKHCPYGYGSKLLVCLDPYYSVAADPNFYEVGDVILIPELRGLLLPNSEVHEGFVIVRDTGAQIRGYGRFDFFIGFNSPIASHPFVNFGLSDKSNHFKYTLIKKSQAQWYLNSRLFPNIPVK